MNQITFDFAGDHEPAFPMAVGEQPQQRLETFGVSAVSDTELLAMVLQGNGTRPVQAVAVASRLMAEAGSLAGLLGWEAADYRRLPGIGSVKGLQLAAVAEIARRMIRGPRSLLPLLNTPAAIATHFQPIVTGLSIEKFWVLLLNRKNRLIKQVEVTSGIATAALAHPREVFRVALRESGPVTAIACVHNHPSGSPEPSAPDLQLTRRLREAAQAVDITLVDHVIVGTVEADPQGRGFYSFREAGVL